MRHERARRAPVAGDSGTRAARARVAPDAEDVAQETSSRICARISDFERGRDGVAWAFGIAWFEIMTHRRRVQRRREIAVEPLTDRVDLSSSAEDSMMQRELVDALEVSLGALSKLDRIALGVESGPAGAGPSAGALRKRRQRALERLRSIWRHVYGG
ncbi:MAG: sigma-70 family RNA polymerase sigma factor [Myxococcales bacterium]|nr:sigma-70 family RNA polymerase sigma factor [Myxococcales bacterium]